MRPVALLLAIVAVLFLGHAVFELIQFGQLAWISLLLGLAAAAAAVHLHRRTLPH